MGGKQDTEPHLLQFVVILSLPAPQLRPSQTHDGPLPCPEAKPPVIYQLPLLCSLGIDSTKTVVSHISKWWEVISMLWFWTPTCDNETKVERKRLSICMQGSHLPPWFLFFLEGASELQAYEREMKDKPEVLKYFDLKLLEWMPGSKLRV